MAKGSDAASKVDAIGCAERCEAEAEACGAAMPSLAAQLKEAATMLRSLHRVLAEPECQHVMTFKVTKAMVESGREKRAPGKYCMTCGEHLDKPEATVDTQGEET